MQWFLPNPAYRCPGCAVGGGSRKAKFGAVQTPQKNSLDWQIDQLVYELFDLTEEEIKLVEESVG